MKTSGFRATHLPPAVIEDWADHVARTFAAQNPIAALARVGVELCVHRRALRARSRTIHGAWDPRLHRIELFGVNDPRTDDEIVVTFGHELWHAMAASRARALGLRGRQASNPPIDEPAAHAFAAAWSKRLSADTIRRCAAVLRAVARDDDPSVPDADAAQSSVQVDLWGGM